MWLFSRGYLKIHDLAHNSYSSKANVSSQLNGDTMTIHPGNSKTNMGCDHEARRNVVQLELKSELFTQLCIYIYIHIYHYIYIYIYIHYTYYTILYIYVYPGSPRSILFIYIRHTYIHSHMRLRHALSRPTTHAPQWKQQHVHMDISQLEQRPWSWKNVYAKVLQQLSGAWCALFFWFFAWSFAWQAPAQILCAAEWLSLGNPKTCKQKRNSPQTPCHPPRTCMRVIAGTHMLLA